VAVTGATEYLVVPAHREIPGVANGYICEKLIPCPGLYHQVCGCENYFDAEDEAVVYFVGPGRSGSSS
jgi:hypothetical protein